MKAQNGEVLCKWLKICIGIVLVAVGIFVVEGTIGTVLIVLGILAVIFGVIGFCPCTCFTKKERSCCLSRKN